MQMKNKFKNEKGIMAAYVTISLVTFAIILSTIFTVAIANRKEQLQTITKIKDAYEKDNDKREKLVKSTDEKSRTQITLTVSSTEVIAGNSVQATVDYEEPSKVDLSKCKYVYNTTADKIGTDISNYTDGSISNGTAFSLLSKSEGTYYLHVLTTLKTGKTIETVSKPIVAITTKDYSVANTTSSKYYTFTAEATGTYKLQVWGAQGGYRNSSTYGGLGGYSTGIISLTKGTKLYVYVGGAGGNSSTSTATVNAGGYNGGGYRYGYCGGGGATDIRLSAGTWNSTSSLYSRVIVAGGGGSDGAKTKTGMYGGGTTGGSSTQSYTANSNYCGKGGTQSYSGYSTSYTITTQATSGLTSNSTSYYCGGFGFGGGGVYLSNGYGGAGGGGWYGGSGTVPDGSADDDRGGGGGSGWVFTADTYSAWQTANSTDSANYTVNTKYYLTDAATYAGNTSFESTTGGTETGHSGDGYARITPISISETSSVVTNK